MTSLRVLWLLLASVLFATGCTRGPETAVLRADVQARLDALFGRPVLVIDTLRRQGSAPYAGASEGAGQAIVYFNARLRFTEPYDPSDWQGLNPQLIARALGATDEGVVGLRPGRMTPGSEGSKASARPSVTAVIRFTQRICTALTGRAGSGAWPSVPCPSRCGRTTCT